MGLAPYQPVDFSNFWAPKILLIFHFLKPIFSPFFYGGKIDFKVYFTILGICYKYYHRFMMR